MRTLSELNLSRLIVPGLRAAGRPDSAMFELTYGCNFRCVHCYNPTHKVRPGELSTVEVRRILDEIEQLGLLSITFTGGELFTRPDVFAILEHARRLGLIVDLLTNASFLTEDLVARIDGLGIRGINVSMYGATETTFERVTGIRGSHARFRRGLASLSKTSAEVAIRMPLMTVNVHEAEAAKTLVEGLGFRFRFYLGIEPRQDGNQTPLQYRLDPDARIQVLRTLSPKDFEKPPCDATDAAGEFLDCACGQDRFAITPYGRMNLCVSFPIPGYDLRSGSVEEGWRVLRETARNARPNERDECPTCALRPFCQQGRADAWLETGDMSVCLPDFKEFAARWKLETERRRIVP